MGRKRVKKFVPTVDDIIDQILAAEAAEALEEADLEREPVPVGLVTLTVPDDALSLRIDKFVSDSLPGLSRSRVQGLIRQGAVEGPAGTISDGGLRVKPGEVFKVTVPEPEPMGPIGEEIPLDIVHEDPDLIVIMKPAGLVVHPAAGHGSGTLVNALVAHCGEELSGIGGVRRPGIVHRLDKDTSGLLVVAKSNLAHQGLAEQFASHGEDGRLSRAYLALVWGHLPRRAGTIDARVGRHPHNRTRMAILHGEAGRHAVTHYEVLETFLDDKGAPLASLIRAHLETGRTHQIRVHFAHIGHPVMGDPVYATGFKTSISRLTEPAQAALEALNRQALHAAALGFEHPATGEDHAFESPLPHDMARLLETLRPAPPKPKTKAKSKPSAKPAAKAAAKPATAAAKPKISKR